MITQWAIVAALLFLACIGAGLTTINVVGSAAYVLGVTMTLMMPTVAYFVLKYVYRESPSFRTFIDTAWSYRRLVTVRSILLLLLGASFWAVTLAVLGVSMELPFWRGVCAAMAAYASGECFNFWRRNFLYADRA